MVRRTRRYVVRNAAMGLKAGDVVEMSSRRAWPVGQKPKRAKMRRPEQEFQINAVAPYLDAVLDPATAMWLHVPNGGARSRVEGGILKAMGLRAGFPDILVLALVSTPAPGGDSPLIEHRICLMELKKPGGGGKLNPNQVETHRRLTNIALVPFLCETLEDVRGALEADGIPMRNHTVAGGGWIVRPQ